MTNLLGLHDLGGEHLMDGDPGWIVDAIAFSETRARDYRAQASRGFGIIVRLNYAWHPRGTIPEPAKYSEMARLCAEFVANSPGCHTWIIGNEFNHAIERPDGREISPEEAAACHRLCYAAIKQVQPHAVVLVGAIAPWNGDWLGYQRRLVGAVGDQCDGYALHAYTHGADPALIFSDEMRHGWFWHFRTYRQQLINIVATRPGARDAEFHITETNQGDDAWVDTNSGWVQNAAQEINTYNYHAGVGPFVRSLSLYRWKQYDHDKWGIEGKQGVIADFQAAIGRGYQSPPVTGVSNVSNTVHIPYVPNESPTVTAPDLPPRYISEDFKRRVPTITLLDPPPGTRYYRLIRAEYVPDAAQRFGPDHHILVDVIDEMGLREMGTSVNFYWADGMEIGRINKVNEPYGADYGMTSVGHSFGVWVGDFRQNSDDVFGMGLGTIEQPDWAHHVSYYLVFQRVTVPAAQTQPPAEPPPTAIEPTPQPIDTPTATVDAPAGANIRSGPGLEFPILGAEPYGDTLAVIGRNAEGDWWQVDMPHMRGWVYGMVVKTHNVADVPVVEVENPPPISAPSEADKWARCRDFVKRWEGGFQDLEWDAGNWTGCEVGKGEKKGTNRGISACAYPHLDIRDLTEAQTDEIFYHDYYLRSGADKQPWPMCLLVYNAAVNFHPTTAQKWAIESRGNALRFVALYLRGYRYSDAWPHAHDAWVHRVIDVAMEASA